MAKNNSLKKYHDLRRAYVEKHGKQPPKGTKLTDLEAMGLQPKKSKKKKKSKRASKRRSRTGEFDWSFGQWAK